ncbi:MAG TPA: FkbM family methyltransferase [Nitrospira sp.]|nr:FkbM family methyltransferase [Nitrospira sp.]
MDELREIEIGLANNSSHLSCGPVKQIIKSVLNSLGLDVRRQKFNPDHTLLGLRKLPIKTIIDVGANTGQFAKNISRLFPDAELICFEPLPVPFRELETWARRKRRVHALNVAIGEAEMEMDMFYHVDHSTSSSLLASTDLNQRLFPFIQQQVKVPIRVTTLDTALNPLQVPIVPDILIKLDAQGYEDRILKGGPTSFGHAAACIVEVSVERLYKGQAGFKDLVVMLDGHGFEYVGNLSQSYAEDGHVIFFDALFIEQKHLDKLAT